MLLDIIRCGSGWGGAHGHWIVDIDNSIAYDIYHDKRRVIKLPDISLLTLLDNCEVSRKSFGCMDQQIDYVYVLNKDLSQRCVLDTNWEVYPENEALYGKLQKLIEYLGGYIS